MSKKITMMQFRASPGEFIHEVSHHGEEFVITRNGKAVAMLVPCELDSTTVLPNGRIIGRKPLTMKGIM